MYISTYEIMCNNICFIIIKCSLRSDRLEFASKASLGPYAWERPAAAFITPELKPDSPQGPQKISVASKPCDGVSSDEAFLQHDELKCLPRSYDVFNKISTDPVLSCKLPRPGSTAGRVLEHSISCFERLYKRYQPMTFKIGITHCASFRWHNKCFGYKYSKDRFDRMLVVYATDNPHGPAFLEAALINLFKGNVFA